LTFFFSLQTSGPAVSPQGYLDGILRARGYSTIRYKTLQSGYYNKPTFLQQQSYHVHLIELLRANNVVEMDHIFASGISPNPCNQYGESFLHNVCRRGATEALQVLLKNGCSLQVADDYGRTPLHDACWGAKPAFDVIDIILSKDVRLLTMTDCRGAGPLAYVRNELWPAWCEYLHQRQDVYWPTRNVATDGEEPPPPLSKLAPNSRPLPDPPHALSPELAIMVASGKMSPDEANILRLDEGTGSWDDSDSDSCDYTSDEDDDEDEDDSDVEPDDESEDFSMDEGELDDLINSIPLPTNDAVMW
jgi:ankyrin repeat protein